MRRSRLFFVALVRWDRGNHPIVFFQSFNDRGEPGAFCADDGVVGDAELAHDLDDGSVGLSVALCELGAKQV